MKYYLVALFDAESYNAMEAIQKNICKKYKFCKNTPMLHISLETIEDPDLDKLSEVINSILKPYKKFKVETNGTICFDPPYKSVDLKIESKGYIIRLARTINEKLKLNGFNVRETLEDFNLHVSLATHNNALREGNSREYAAACTSTRKDEFSTLVKISRLELWRTLNNKKEMLIKSFPLKDY